MGKNLTGVVILFVVSLLLIVGCTSAPAPVPAPKPTSAGTPSPTAAPTAAPSPKPTTPASGAEVKPIEIKWVIYSTTAKEEAEMAYPFVEALEQRAKGALKFRLLGGQEVIPMTEQPEAVRRHVVDAAATPASYAAGFMPEANAHMISRLSAEERRKSGFEDFINEIYQKNGFYYLIALDPSGFDEHFRLFTNFKMDKPEDLKNHKMRGGAAYSVLLDKFGATAVGVAPPDMYTALERGVIDGLTVPPSSLFDFQLQKVTKYYVVPGMGMPQIVWLFDLAKWNSIPPQLQKLMKDTVIDLEKEWTPKKTEMQLGWLPKLDKSGLTRLTLSEDGGKRMRDVFYEANWADIIAKSPVNGAKLKELSKK